MFFSEKNAKIIKKKLITEVASYFNFTCCVKIPERLDENEKKKCKIWQWPLKREPNTNVSIEHGGVQLMYTIQRRSWKHINLSPGFLCINRWKTRNGMYERYK